MSSWVWSDCGCGIHDEHRVYCGPHLIDCIAAADKRYEADDE